MSIRLGRVSEDTIRNALLYIRAEIVRGNLDGLEHVDALLQMRGHEPCHVPRRTDRRFKRGELARLILEGLREGPMTGRQIAGHVASRRGGLTADEAYKRVYVALAMMQARGQVRHEGRQWLAQEGPAPPGFTGRVSHDIERAWLVGATTCQADEGLCDHPSQPNNPLFCRCRTGLDVTTTSD